MTSQVIGVIGAGTMGSGIAQTCAVAGLAVHRDFGDPKYRPAPGLKEMVAAGYLDGREDVGSTRMADTRSAGNRLEASPLPPRSSICADPGFAE